MALITGRPRRLGRWMSVGIAGVLLATAGAAQAQWLNYPTPGIPRTSDGKPNLSAPAPRTADGKPDLSGLWQADDLARGDGRHFFDIAQDLKAGELSPLPWADALQREREDNNHKDDPYAHCVPPGVPRINNTLHPFKIIQIPQLTVMLHELATGSTFRQVFTDGRPLPKDPQPTWLGYSVGRWDGDTLVVDTTGFNDGGWLDTRKGRPHSDLLHVTERFRRRDFGHMNIDVTIDDAKAYTKPWTVKLGLLLLPDTELLEGACENDQDRDHLVGK